MDKSLRTKMIFHGAIVVLLGLVAGLPYASVVSGALEGSERAWRMAHLEGVLNGLILFAVAGVWRRLALDDRKKAIAAWSLVATGYGNVIAATLGAATGNRGLAFEPPLANAVVFTLFVVAIVGVFVGIGLVAYGARPGARAVAETVHVEVSTTTSATASSADPGDGTSGYSSRSSRRRSRRRR